MKPFTPDDLRRIARAQRRLVAAIGFILLIVVGVIALEATVDPRNPTLGEGLASVALGLLALVMGVVQIIATYRVAKALGSPVAWLWALCMLVPFLCWILMLVLNHKATRVLRQAGICVGLWGAGKQEVEQALGAPPPSVP